MMYTPTYVLPGKTPQWADRIDAACRVMEETFDIRLDKASSYRDGEADVGLVDRRAFLKRKARSRTKWLNIYTGSGIAVTPSGYRNLDYFALGGRSYANAEVYHCSTHYPEAPPATHEDLLVRLGDALGACWGQYTPAATARRLRQVQWCACLGSRMVKQEVRDMSPEERRLPLLGDTQYSPLESPLRPGWAGWLNYWSREVAAYLGFPDEARDSELLRHAYRTPAGGWLVKLGPAPLDAADPEHVMLLARVYERFPRLGFRPPGAVDRLPAPSR